MKLKKLILLIVLFITFFSFNFVVGAEDIFTAIITGDSVNLRTGPGTNYGTNGNVAINSSFKMVSDKLYPSEKGCLSGWYNIYQSGSNTSYVCSDFVKVVKSSNNPGKEPDNACEIEMKNAGFPSSYWPGLCTVKAIHPTWSFKALITNLDWKSAVDSESACGKSYIATNNEEYKDYSCYNKYKDTWYPASQKAVSYYMDPRNFLTESNVFQFEYLKYDNNLKDYYANGANAIISNTEFNKYHLSVGNNLGNLLNTVGSETDVSPIFLSSKILIELGRQSSLYNLYSGIYEGDNKIYYGYYNFYNFGVTDSCANTYGTTYCGLNYALNFGWNSVYAALKGGSGMLASSYIAKGQYTSYLQKFNVVPTDPSKIYGHQYQTDIVAPHSMSYSTYNTYKNLDLLNSYFMFYIPVYNGMENAIDGGGSGPVNPDIPSVDPSVTPINTIVTSSGYRYEANLISNIAPGSDVALVKSNLEAIGGNGTVVITDKLGNKVTSGNIGTGFKISISNKISTEVLEVIIRGDTSGDGIINALDLLQVQKNILGTYNLTGVNLFAGDSSKDGKVNALDLLQIQKSLLKTYDIGQ